MRVFAGRSSLHLILYRSPRGRDPVGLSACMETCWPLSCVGRSDGWAPPPRSRSGHGRLPPRRHRNPQRRARARARSLRVTCQECSREHTFIAEPRVLEVFARLKTMRRGSQEPLWCLFQRGSHVLCQVRLRSDLARRPALPHGRAKTKTQTQTHTQTHTHTHTHHGPCGPGL